MACDRNGYLGEECLRPLMGGYFAAPGPAAAWNAFGGEMKRRFGVVIRVNGPDSAYRPYDRQVYWRNYWCSRGACQNAAIPGTSNHGLGWAFDVPDYVTDLLESHGASYGFRRACSDAPWENWHWKWCGGWEGRDPGPDGERGPRYPVLTKGDVGNEVKRAQKHLRRWNLGLTRPVSDGGFGAVTERAVEEFQIVHGLEPDGVVGAATWKKLRLKDRFLDDERLHINRFRLARHEDRPLDRHRKFAARRAVAIRRTAQKQGWGEFNRRTRFKTLRRIAGEKLYEDAKRDRRKK